jgi:predicted Holliday junction resolvase-like endonuclease
MIAIRSHAMNEVARKLLAELHGQSVHAACPECNEGFPLESWKFFTLDQEQGETAVSSWEEAIKAERKKLEKILADLRARVSSGTKSGRLGTAVESIAPFHPAIGQALGNPRDVRFLGDPLDFVVFNGVTEHGRVESLLFAELKTGEDPDLNDAERRVRQLVRDKCVTFEPYDADAPQQNSGQNK